MPLKPVQQDIYDLLNLSPKLAGVEVSYGESYLENASDQLVTIFVSSCDLSENQIHPDTEKFTDLVGEYEISIHILAGSYLAAAAILNNVGDAIIQEDSDHAYYFQSYNADPDGFDNNVVIELSLGVSTFNEPRGN